jgi:HSP20 family protein
MAMTLIHKERFGLDVPDIWRRMFENDVQSGWLRVEEFADGDDFVIRSEIPGIDPERDVELTIDDGVLRISARREERSEHKDKDGFRSEFRYGTFVRSVVLPRGVDEDDIRASYKDGILEIRISGAGANKREAKKITVTKE